MCEHARQLSAQGSQGLSVVSSPESLDIAKDPYQP